MLNSTKIREINEIPSRKPLFHKAESTWGGNGRKSAQMLEIAEMGGILRNVRKRVTLEKMSGNREND